MKQTNIILSSTKRPGNLSLSSSKRIRRQSKKGVGEQLEHRTNVNSPACGETEIADQSHKPVLEVIIPRKRTGSHDVDPSPTSKKAKHHSQYLCSDERYRTTPEERKENYMLLGQLNNWKNLGSNEPIPKKSDAAPIDLTNENSHSSTSAQSPENKKPCSYCGKRVLHSRNIVGDFKPL